MARKKATQAPTPVMAPAPRAAAGKAVKAPKPAKAESPSPAPDIADTKDLVDSRAVGPSNADLKTRFSAQKIPLAADFANLIDVADVGRKAVGMSPGQQGVGPGLQLAADGRLAVKVGAGLTVDAVNGIGINSGQIIPAGVIVMFQGAAVPPGWALCDGKNGTPDLQDRFILGGSFAQIGGNKGKAVGNAEAKRFPSSEVSSAAPLVHYSVTISGTSLTPAQIPRHCHDVGIRLAIGGTLAGYTSQLVAYPAAHIESFQAGVRRLNTETTTLGEGPFVTPETSYVGSGQPHTHTSAGAASQEAHAHTVDVMPPYYILAFIIKL